MTKTSLENEIEPPQTQSENQTIINNLTKLYNSTLQENNNIYSSLITTSGLIEIISASSLNHFNYQTPAILTGIIGTASLIYGLNSLNNKKSKISEYITKKQLKYNPKTLEREFNNY